MLILPEAHYLYGTGRLILQVEQVDRTRAITYDGDVWYTVEGVEVATNGQELWRRTIMVRARLIDNKET